ncbi:MAG: sigma-70 family RNA polymerase sigma factor [Planctomycetaceae bacterium]|nr:sigma-70 family RNA polymerase sigma factor [Planctomycetaceae bacterium]
MREQSKSDNDRDAIQEDGTSSDSVHGSGASLLIDPDQWVDLHGDYLYRYAFARLRDTNASEEVVQETFLAGIRFQDRYNGRGTERAWLLGILKRKIVDYIRLRNRFNRDGLTEDGGDPSALLFDARGNWKAGMLPASLPDQAAESKELWDVVRDCLQHLPSGQADVFVLSVMEDMETDEICRQLEITPTNLWVRLHRARLALARCVNARWFAKEEEATSHAK